MNDNTQMTSAPGASLIPDGTSVITTMHLVIIMIFALFVIVAILWGMRLKRRRRAADQEIARNNAQLVSGDAHQSATPARQKPVSTPSPAPVPLTPAPPPLDDAPVIGIPPEIGATSESYKQETAPETAPAAADAIPLTTLKGLGPKVAARLGELGITDARQLATMDETDAAALDAQLGSFSGRMARDRWIDQARLLASGDKAGYEATFGKL
ncbi:MAG: hypothetical protein OSB00_16325 [Sphingomonas bacterium]|nr:hypothetical protein [Sphingomonas bacterium]